MNSVIWLMPRISEKSYNLANSKNTYMFDVPLHANKQQIAAAVEDQYSVAVIGVRTTINKGKRKGTPLRRRMPIDGRRSDTKRAFVTLKTGNTIPVFEEA